MMSKLDSEKKVVGTKQVRRAILSGKVEAVYIAKDSEEKVIRDVKELCKEKEINIVYIDTMKELGKFCGIDVSAASAALLK